ncbi:inositol monophosphatase [Patescibacteria group bacterium]|nr:inositol monophosphatase [Patescibacteria group bacterium]MBU0963546.1 inositol monophosphatase [Patescibacteria group bacterium]
MLSIDELDTIAKIAQSVGSTVLEMRDQIQNSTITKGLPHNIATKADTEAECLLVIELKKHFPNIGINGEEGSRFSGTDGVFHIDPVDGTINYIAGLDFGISIGLEIDQQFVAGVLYFPITKVCLMGGLSLGSWCNGQQLKPIPTKPELHQLIVGYEYSTYHTRDRDILTDLSVLAPAIRYTYLLGCTTFACQRVMLGNLHAFISSGTMSVDIAAAVPILQEIGGIATTLDNKPIMAIDQPLPVLLAPNQHIHQLLLNLFAR